MPPVPLPSIAQGPETPQVRYNAPSGVSDAFDQLGKIGNQIADDTATLAAQKNATADQTAAGNNSVAIDDSSFPSLYDEAYNKTANLIFGATKKNQMDAGLATIYQQNMNNPDGYAAAANDFKAQYMANVPALQQANFSADFDNHSSANAVDVLGNQTQLTRNTALTTTTDRLAYLNNSIYAATLANGGNAVDLPQVKDQIAERQSLMQSLTDPTQLGGPLKSAPEVEQMQLNDTAYQRQGELLHQFNLIPYVQQDEWVTHLEQTGDSSAALNPLQFKSLIGDMKQSLYFSRGAHQMQEQQIRSDANDAITVLTSGHTPDGLDALQGQVASLGDPVLSKRFYNAQVISTQLAAFGLLPPAQMGQKIDDLNASLTAGTATALDVEELKSMQGIYAQSQTELATDPLKFAATRHVAPAASLAPLNLTDPNSIQSRMDGVRRTEAQYGITVSPLRPDDVRALSTQWPTLTADQQVATIRGLNNLGMTSQESGLVYQKLDKENPALPTVARMLASPETAPIARDALDGLDYFKNNKDTVDKDGAVQREIDGQLSRLYQQDPSGQSLQATSPLALGLYVKNAARSGTFTVPSAFDAQTAADTAVANLFGYKALSEMPSINGKSVIPFAPGMADATHKDIWSSITDDDLKAMNGGQLPTNSYGGKSTPVSAQQIIGNSFPIYTGKPGLYQIGQTDGAGNLFVLKGTNGSPFIFNATTQAATFKQRGPAPLTAADLTHALGTNRR